MAHTIIIDGANGSGRKMLGFELALVLLYNMQKTALLLTPNSTLKQTILARQTQYPNLPTPQILNREDFIKKNNEFDAIIIPEINAFDDLAINSSTYITLIPQKKKYINNFEKDINYINSIWELKKKIAANHKRTLNWVICENNLFSNNSSVPSAQLEKLAKTYGFRLAPPLTNRKTYFLNHIGISAQDKNTPQLTEQMSYEDICAKREIIKLAEFIFGT